MFCKEAGYSTFSSRSYSPCFGLAREVWEWHLNAKTFTSGFIYLMPNGTMVVAEGEEPECASPPLKIYKLSEIYCLFSVCSNSPCPHWAVFCATRRADYILFSNKAFFNGQVSPEKVTLSGRNVFTG